MAKPITPTEVGTSVELGFDAEARAAIEAYREALRLKADADKAKAEAEEILRAKLGVHEFATIGGQVVFKIAHVDRQDPDRKELAKFPEVFQAVMKSNPYDFIRLVK